MSDLATVLLRQELHHADLLAQARSLGTKPEARMVWELVHEAASLTAKTRSRLQHESWTQ